MSHYVKNQVEGMNDQQCLEAAMTEKGYKFEVGDKLKVNSGYGTSTVQIKLPRGSGAGNSYEAGFVKDAKTGNFTLVKESMDGKLGKKWTDDLKQVYVKHQAIKLARAKGLKLASTRQIGAKLQLVFNT